MEKYISKSALVAKIKERIETYNKGYANGDDRRADALEVLLHDIDTLEVKKQLTWQDIKLISEIGENFMNSEESDNLSEEEYYTEILNKFKAQKYETDII